MPSHGHEGLKAINRIRTLLDRVEFEMKPQPPPSKEEPQPGKDEFLPCPYCRAQPAMMPPKPQTTAWGLVHPCTKGPTDITPIILTHVTFHEARVRWNAWSTNGGNGRP